MDGDSVQRAATINKAVIIIPETYISQCMDSEKANFLPFEECFFDLVPGNNASAESEERRRENKDAFHL